MKAILAAAWGAFLLIASLPSAAAVPSDWQVRSATVHYSDLNLARPQGQATLQRRVTGAVHQVCDNGDFSLHEKMQQHACVKLASATASHDVGKAIAVAKQLPSAKTFTSQTLGSVQKTVSSTSKAVTAPPFAGSSSTTNSAAFGKQIMAPSRSWEKQEAIPQR